MTSQSTVWQRERRSPLTALDVTLSSASDFPANSYTGNFTIQMVDNGLNQDSCESGSVPLTVSVSTTDLTRASAASPTTP